jgi:hypothetical protein
MQAMVNCAVPAVPLWFIHASFSEPFVSFRVNSWKNKSERGQ